MVESLPVSLAITSMAQPLQTTRPWIHLVLISVRSQATAIKPKNAKLP